MKVPRMPVGVLEPETAFAEIHLAGDARFLHPLQRAVDGRAADPVIFAFDQIDEIVGAEVSLLLEERVDDQVPIPLAGFAGMAALVAMTWNVSFLRRER